jgi:GTPase
MSAEKEIRITNALKVLWEEMWPGYADKEDESFENAVLAMVFKRQLAPMAIHLLGVKLKELGSEAQYRYVDGDAAYKILEKKSQELFGKSYEELSDKIEHFKSCCAVLDAVFSEGEMI